MSILDNEGHDPNGLGNDPRPTRIRNAEDTILDLRAEIERLRKALEVAAIAMERAAESLPSSQSIGHAWGLLDGNAKATRKILSNQ